MPDETSSPFGGTIVSRDRIGAPFRDDGEVGDGEPVDLEPSLRITIDPPGSDQLDRPQHGEPMTLTGGIGAVRVVPTKVTVKVGNAEFPASFLWHSTHWRWECTTVRVNAPGYTVLAVEVDGRVFDTTDELRHARAEWPVHIFDQVKPTLGAPILTLPPDGQVPVGESGAAVELTVRATDALGVQRVECRLDATNHMVTQATRKSEGSDEWTASIEIPYRALGSRAIEVRCIDRYGNISDPQTVSFFARDDAPPQVELREPRERVIQAHPPEGGPAGVTVTLAGRVRDIQSGMVGGKAAVEWSLSAEPGLFTPASATPNPDPTDWREWHAEVHNLDYGPHTIHVRFTDHTGKTRTEQVDVEVISSYQPRDLEERLTPRFYLQDLLRYARDHFEIPNEGPLTSERLAATFHQPFGRLSQSLAEVGGQPINELRVPIEAMRRYVGQGPAHLAAHWTFTPDALLGGLNGGPARVSDRSGNGNIASVTPDAALEDGHNGGTSLRFDGVSRYARVDQSQSLTVGRSDTDFSVAFWIYVRQAPSGEWRSIMHKGATDTDRTFALLLRPGTNRLQARIRTETDGSAGLDTNVEEIAHNTWTHVALVKSGRQLLLYVDGALDSSAALPAPVVGSDGPLYFGKTPWQTGVDGRLDDVRIYDAALSGASIKALANGQSEDAAPQAAHAAEARYRRLAYESLLAGMGTSYAELRLLRGAAPTDRKALADRLGIRLGADTPDHMEQLTLGPTALTEHALEELFGLLDTDPTKDPLRTVPKPKVLRWQEEHIRDRWWSEDHSQQLAANGLPVLIDPDLVGTEDLRPGVSADTERILARRQVEIQRIFDHLKGMREAQTTPAAGLEAILRDTFPDVDLGALFQRYRGGANVDADLGPLHLTREMLSHLVRFQSLALRGEVMDEEWLDAYHILTQVKKRRRAAEWRAEEQSIALTPDHFVVGTPGPVPSPWRATRQARDAWGDTLRARLDQQRALTEAFYANVAAAEQIALPVLRDALVEAAAIRQSAADSGDQLAERLLVDVKVGGSLQTTRTLQAIDTLQSLIFSARTSRFAESHPAHQWRALEHEERFDEEWTWMGTFETWRAATSVFLFPENVLWPSLRSDQTQPFRDLVGELRKRPRLTPADARMLAVRYLVAHIDGIQRSLPGPVARWKLDEGSGDAIADTNPYAIAGATSNTSAGTRQGATWREGYFFNYALGFDGLDDRVDIQQPSDALKKLQDTFTLAFWVNPESTHQVDQEATTGNSGTTGKRYVLLGPVQRDAGGAEVGVSVGVSVGTNGVSVYEHAESYLPARLVYEAPIVGWTHVAVVYESRRPRLFINGRLVKEGAGPSVHKPHVYAPTASLGGVSYGYFHGRLADVRIYAQALTPDEIDLLSFTITDRRTAGELRAMRALSERLLTRRENAPLQGTTPVVLREVFLFVPLQLALQLQRAGQYIAALDWYQNLYSHTLPEAVRKVSYALASERNTPPNLAMTAHWAREWLDPHLVASRRPNPYTRFTLMGITRCCLEFADSEFARETGESLVRARAMYLTAGEILALPDLGTPKVTAAAAVALLPNPALDALRARAEQQLAKLRQGRNIAGMKRTVELAPTASAPAGVGFPSVDGVGPAGAPPAVHLRPTPYRYRVLIERSKQLVGIAEQVEAAYLAALEKFDEKQYRRFDANRGLDLANAGVELQTKRVQEAARGVSLAEKQKGRAEFVKEEYGKLIDAGLNDHEDAMIKLYWQAKTLRDVIAGIDAANGLAQLVIQGQGITKIIDTGGSVLAASAVSALAIIGKAATTTFLNSAETRIEVNSLLASHERRVEEWRLQHGLAEHDSLIAAEQILAAKDHKAVVEQEEKIARIQADQARALVEFLDRQFTNADLYEWMSGVLAGVYGYFLQQATATARLAQNQLAFERQEAPPPFVRADYWQPPAEEAVPGRDAKDRRGLTGSARLLQDIHQLDHYAFESDKRKLNLTQTFSLARLAPQELQRLRQTGVMTFATPMQWFDQAFPGHYLRLIKQVRTSVVALVPPHQGIRATLTADGSSRVVVAGDTFRELVVRRDPESVALTSPIGATGVFEVDTQAEMLLPFEAMGVATTWELRMPKAANSFDYRTLMDVLFTVEYTALSSPEYRRQVIAQLDSSVEVELPFSLRDQFPDQWYELQNPDQSSTPLTMRFTTTPDDFPPNVDDLRIAQILLQFAGKTGETVRIAVEHLHFVPLGENPATPLGGSALADGDGAISTRRSNGQGAWSSLQRTNPPVRPFGAWELKLAASALSPVRARAIEDILLVLTCAGRAPAWPADTFAL